MKDVALKVVDRNWSGYSRYFKVELRIFWLTMGFERKLLIKEYPNIFI